jgi:hypothetical protein
MARDFLRPRNRPALPLGRDITSLAHMEAASSRPLLPWPVVVGLIVGVAGCATWAVYRLVWPPIVPGPPATLRSARFLDADKQRISEMQHEHTVIVRSFLARYDFERALSVTRPKLGDPMFGEHTRGFILTLERMAALKRWLPAAMRAYARERPLQVADFTGQKRDLRAYAGVNDQQVAFADGSLEARPLRWEELNANDLGCLIVAAVKASPPPPDVKRGAELFAGYYKVPLMREMLTGVSAR